MEKKKEKWSEVLKNYEWDVCFKKKKMNVKRRKCILKERERRKISGII